MKITDELLYEAAPKAAELFLSTASEEQTHEFSPRFERRMRPLLADPEGYIKRRTRPLWKKVLRAAACVLLACALSLGALRAVSPTAYAAFASWVTEWYETHVVYRFSGAPVEDALPRYRISSLPEGFAETDHVVEAPGYRGVAYQNAAGEEIYFTCERMTQGSAHGVLLESMTVKDVMVGGCPGQLYRSQDPAQSSAVIWMDEEAGLLFSIDAFAEESVLLHMAASVSLEDPTK